jgi:superfamily I DNA and/or RNA helicase
LFIITPTFPSGVNLLGATAWTLCRDDFEKTFDYLFIDESGQVPLSNCLGMSTSCDNLVLLGDQMQLGSPIQAAHPGDSGNTILDYILKDTFVVPPEKGVFLSRTWRMHPDVCRFISDAIYDSKLHPVERTKNQILLLNDNLEGVIKPTGLSYIPVNHVGNSQSSEEEAEVILKLYKELLNSKYKDHSGRTKNLTTENILVVAPYNMQVNLLKKVLAQRRKGRNGGQIPGTGSRGGLRITGNIITGQTPQKLRFPVQQKQAERSNLPSKNQGNPCILTKTADSKLQ